MRKAEQRIVALQAQAKELTAQCRQQKLALPEECTIEGVCVRAADDLLCFSFTHRAPLHIDLSPAVSLFSLTHWQLVVLQNRNPGQGHHGASRSASLSQGGPGPVQAQDADHLRPHAHVCGEITKTAHAKGLTESATRWSQVQEVAGAGFTESPPSGPRSAPGQDMDESPSSPQEPHEDVLQSTLVPPVPMGAVLQREELMRESKGDDDGDEEAYMYIIEVVSGGSHCEDGTVQHRILWEGFPASRTNSWNDLGEDYMWDATPHFQPLDRGGPSVDRSKMHRSIALQWWCGKGLGAATSSSTKVQVYGNLLTIPGAGAASRAMPPRDLFVDSNSKATIAGVFDFWFPVPNSTQHDNTTTRRG